jgi:hypothetical protein
MAALRATNEGPPQKKIINRGRFRVYSSAPTFHNRKSFKGAFTMQATSRLIVVLCLFLGLVAATDISAQAQFGDMWWYCSAHLEQSPPFSGYMSST